MSPIGPLADTLPSTLPAALRRAPLLLGFSGGLDSTVLLHLLLALSRVGRLGELRAVHVHHGLQAQADAWQRHCEQVCTDLGVPLHCLRVDGRAEAKRGPEGAAREARRRAFAQLLRPGEILVTAHHRGDQAETVLLQLLRGAGAAGLSAMPGCQPWAGGWHWRPLLDVPRERLREEACTRGLTHVEDPSNPDPRYARGLLRSAVLPALRTHWPEAEATLARAARQFAQTQRLLDDLARLDRQAVSAQTPGGLDIRALGRLPVHRRLNLLRYWLAEAGVEPPPRRRLESFLTQIDARADAAPSLSWTGGSLRRYRDVLYFLLPQPPWPDALSCHWQGYEPLVLPELGLALHLREAPGEGLRHAVLAQGVRVTRREGGEGMYLAGRTGRQSLKKLLQESAIPPWERDRLLLLRVGNDTAEVLGLWRDRRYTVGANETGLVVERRPLG